MKLVDNPLSDHEATQEMEFSVSKGNKRTV